MTYGHSIDCRSFNSLSVTVCADRRVIQKEVNVGLKERKEREKENRRGMILEAGQKLFIEKGLASTTMDDIAR